LSSFNLEEIEQKVEDSKDFLKQVKRFVDKNFIINGKTFDEWEEYFKVKIPNNIDFTVLVHLATEVGNKFQEAAYFRDQQMVKLAILDQERSDRMIKAYNKVRLQHQEEYNKNLSAKSCEMAASLHVKSLDDAMVIQKAVKEFWTKTCVTLTETRKILEVIGYALGADVRAQKDFKVTTSGETI